MGKIKILKDCECKNRSCSICEKKRKHETYMKNRDYCLKRQKEYYKNNKEKIKLYQKEYIKKNPEKIREYYNRDYIKAKMKIINQKYTIENKGKISKQKKIYYQKIKNDQHYIERKKISNLRWLEQNRQKRRDYEVKCLKQSH